MIRYFQKIFALSEQGAKDLRSSILWHTLLDFSFVLPLLLAFAFLDDYIKVLTQNMLPQRGIFFYIVFALLSFAVMYFISYIDYQKAYTKIYGESASRRIKLGETLRQLPMAFFGKKDIADLSSTIMEDVTQIEELFSHSVAQIFAAVISMSVMTLALFFYNWQLSLAMFWVVPTAFLFFYLSKNYINRTNQNLYQKKREISDNIQNGIDMVQEIKSYNQEESYLKTLNKTLDDYEQLLVKGETISGAIINASYFLLKLGLPSVIFAGAYLLANNSINIFVYLVFIVMVGRIYDTFIDSLNNMAALLNVNVRINRMKEMDNMPRQTGKKEFHPQNFTIEFKDVDFSYEKETQTLKNISFVAKQGEVTALIGPSGGGKSTVARLSARFWDIDKGKITLGGEDISEIEPEALLQSYSIVFQDVTLFNSTVKENIRLGKKDASDAEVERVARLARCEEFIKKLPQGYDTLIGENGARLSGGERQRISIARALLKDAQVILLDEATASIDVENESKIQEAISELVKNKTVLIIAHRMRTVASADKIIAIKEGKIVESGSPQELKIKGGLFAAMLQAQTAG